MGAQALVSSSVPGKEMSGVLTPESALALPTSQGPELRGFLSHDEYYISDYSGTRPWAHARSFYM